MLILIFAVIFLLIVVTIGIFYFQDQESYEELDIDYWRKQWNDIVKLLANAETYAQRQAVIEADKLFDKLLQHQGFGGNSLGERLKIAQSKYHNLRRIWPAHLLRNKLVHESSYRLTKIEAKQAVESFARGLKELGLDLK